jgi:DAK2 domain fusion protein YloV
VLKQANVVDSGGQGFLFMLIGMLEAIKGHEIAVQHVVEDIHKKESNIADIKFTYCTEMLIDAKSKNSSKLKAEIESFGDSIIVVGDEDLIKVHIHTNSPGLVLQKGLEYGELVKVKIDNMKLQHENVIFESNKDRNTHAKKYGFLAVSPGEGISSLFQDLGCDIVIDGGQTMNPSALDILNGLKEINAENIIVFPNNKNVVMTCEQAKSLSDKNVHVINTYSFNQAISAMINFDVNASVDDAIKNINDTIDKVTTVEITYSIRDTVLDGVEIKTGEILGFVNGQFVDKGTDYNEVARQIVSNAVSADTSIITIYYGKEVEEEDAKKLLNTIVFDGDVDLQYGGQLLYYYVISIE